MTTSHVYRRNVWTSHQSQAFAKEHASKSEPKPFSAQRSAQSSWPACIRPLLAHVRSMHSSEAHRVRATRSPRLCDAERLFSTHALVSCGGLPRLFPSLAHPSTVVLGSPSLLCHVGMDVITCVGHHTRVPCVANVTHRSTHRRRGRKQMRWTPIRRDLCGAPTPAKVTRSGAWKRTRRSLDVQAKRWSGAS